MKTENTAPAPLQPSDFNLYPARNDQYGNDRWIVHFLTLLKSDEGQDYDLAAKRANSIGGRKYTGKDFGGGIVFNGHEDQVKQRICTLVNSL